MDEAHVIKEWGGTFHSDYLKLGPLCYLWLQVIPIVLRSTTVSPQMVPDLSMNLHLSYRGQMPRYDKDSICAMAKQAQTAT